MKFFSSSKIRRSRIALIWALFACILIPARLFSFNSPSFMPKENLKQFIKYNITNSFLYTDLLLQMQDIDPENPQSIQDTGRYVPIFFKLRPNERINNDHSRDEFLRNKYMPKDLKTEYTLDSTVTKISAHTSFESLDAGDDYDLSLDKYLSIRKKSLENDLWDTLTTKYDLEQGLSGGDISKMLSAATGLTIPLPPNPVLNLFGKPQVNINVSGEVNLRMGWRWDSQNLGTVSTFGQTQSSPIFSQDIRVVVNASLGDKLKFTTDWSTRRMSDFDNKFKIGYEGEDDDIIKLIEVGNVSMPTQSTLIGSSQSLFGIRADFQFGPLFIKTIAAQKRGEKKYITVNSGSSKQYFSIHAYDYAKNHFFLDSVYYKFYDQYFSSATPVLPNSAEASYYRIKGDIEVWESTGDVQQIGVSAKSVALTNLPGKRLKQGESYDDTYKKAQTLAGEVQRANFVRLDSTRYKVDLNLGTIAIINMRQDRVYAVSYRIEGPTSDPNDDIYYGTPSPGDTLVLKMIYQNNLQPGFKTLWDRQMKNIYSINATNVNTSDTKIGIYYYNKTNDSLDVLSDANDKLVTIFRVDQVNNSTGNAPPDGQFDLKLPFFDATYGEITFPARKPFTDGLYTYYNKLGTPQLATKYMYADIYDTTYEAAKLNTARDRFVISGEVSGKATNRISLNAYNLAQGSVKVTLDGVELKEWDDYVVDYNSGYITLRNARATLPNAKLKIEYEQQDVLSVSTKTLLGLRADMNIFKTRTVKSDIGMTLMYYDQSAIQDRVRLGEEPVSNTMLGFDSRTQIDAPWLTKLLDKLPFYNTKAMSTLTLKGEWAMIFPEPNKKLSDVTSDHGEPVVYIDDFEGSEKYISLGTTPSIWQHSSPPMDSTIAATYEDEALYRGKTCWFQYFRSKVPIKDAYPNKETYQGRSNFSPFYMIFNPYERGIYNKNPEYLDSLNPQFDKNNIYANRPGIKPKLWGGFQRLLSSFNTNFDSENIEYIEIMMQVQAREPGQTRMFIDLGQISEDIIPNNALNTEDGITEANPLPNGIIDAGEDVGIDAWSDKDEQKFYPYPLNLEKDPAKDDYHFDFNKDDDTRTDQDFADYNNFEGNASVSEMGQFPDTEILNKNNGQNVFLDNSYFTYEINLVPDPTINKQIVGGNPAKGWYLWRIPIRRPDNKVGNPLYSNIQYVRVRFQGGYLKAAVESWKLTGSNWQRNNNIQSNVSTEDSTLQVSFISTEENSSAPDYYTMPPGVKAPHQLNNPDPSNDIKLNEQSLLLSVKNLKYGDERMAVRYFNALDIFYYKHLKFFIHGDSYMPESNDVPKAYAFLRFGIDSSNYYEYRRPLSKGWQDIDIELAKLTAVKQLRDSLGQYERMEFPIKGEPGSFIIKGNPILTKVQFFGFGIANSASQYPSELTTAMWVDELRLLSPEDRNDWAAIASADLKLADLATITATFQHSNSNFHKLEERYGDRTANTDWTVAVTGNLEKFAPASFREMKVPISYTHAETDDKPEYEASNDVNLEQAAQAAYQNAIAQGYSKAQAESMAESVRKRSQTLKVDDSWALTGVKLGIPVKSWLVRETINRLVFSYAYAQEWERSPTVSSRFTWNWRMTTQYSVTIPDLLVVKPCSSAKNDSFWSMYNNWKFNFLPSSFSTSLNMTRGRTTEQSRFLDYPSPVYRNFSAQRQAQFNWKFSENGFISPVVDYNFNTSSTLVPYELDETGKQRTGSQIADIVLFNDGKILNLGIDNNHTQTFALAVKPKLPIPGLSRYLDMSGNFNTTYNWTDPLQEDPKTRDIVKNVNFTNTIKLNNAFKLKALADSWYGNSKLNTQSEIEKKVFARKQLQKSKDSTNSMSIFDYMAKYFKILFLDYEKIDINFTQNNSSINPGVFGGSGFTNFWRGTVGMDNDPIWGPSLPYQLGLITSPHGDFGLTSSDKFPFFGFRSYAGPRPANAVLQENYSQKSTLDAKTTRPLWPGATLDLNWQTELGFNKNQTLITDSICRATATNITATQSFTRTFLSLPKIFGVNIFNNNIEHVISLYRTEENKIENQHISDTLTKNRKKFTALANSFYNGLEAFSLTGGSIGKFLPALNWTIRWDGLEKWSLWSSIVKKASIEHSYQSRYTEAAQFTDNGKNITNQAVQSGFQPLIGVNVAFDDKILHGNLTASLKWNSTNGYSVTSANGATISGQSTDEFQIQAAYLMKGFEFPLFGLVLKNDLEYSFLASLKKNRNSTFDVMSDNNSANGRTLNGNTQITVEPRVSYTMSNKVRASFFVRYEKTITAGAASPGYSTTQVGLDIRISIAGGR